MTVYRFMEMFAKRPHSAKGWNLDWDKVLTTLECPEYTHRIANFTKPTQAWWAVECRLGTLPSGSQDRHRSDNTHTSNSYCTNPAL